MLAGLVQIGAALLKLGFVMRYVLKSVMTGFVNALAIIYLFPYVTKVIPSPLVTILVLTALTLVCGWNVRKVGDMGAVPDTLPVFLIPDMPLTLETLLIVLPYPVAVVVVGLLESLMTQNIVDDLTGTKSDRNQECIGQGIANTATGFIGGMAGCAMIGQSIINVKSGGRGRRFGAGLGASSGADMCPASDAAIVMPRARMVFAGRVQIKAACPEALCCALALPIPSHGCCANLLLALLRVLRPRDRRSACTAVAGDW